MTYLRLLLLGFCFGGVDMEDAEIDVLTLFSLAFGARTDNSPTLFQGLYCFLPLETPVINVCTPLMTRWRNFLEVHVSMFLTMK